MLHKKLFLALTLSIGLLPVNVLCSESSQSWSDWGWGQIAQKKAALASAYETGKSKFTASVKSIAGIPQSIMNAVSNWNTQKKIAVMSAIVTSLIALGIYNKDTIVETVANMAEKAQSYAEKALEYAGDLTPKSVKQHPMLTAGYATGLAAHALYTGYGEAAKKANKADLEKEETQKPNLSSSSNE